jgi:hypothetical protein
MFNTTARLVEGDVFEVFQNSGGPLGVNGDEENNFFANYVSRCRLARESAGRQGTWPSRVGTLSSVCFC